MPLHDPEVTLSAFEGPGEMRRLCRSLDWASTPLGAVESWPTLLKLTSQMVLGSGFPMIINWGSELIAIYNDAFTPLVGGRHPFALGHSPKEIWPESWEFASVRLNDVMQNGTTLRFDDERQILERNGYPEECFFTFSQSPITGADGDVVGMLTVATETTAKMLNERRMQIVRDLGTMSSTEHARPRDTLRSALQVLESGAASVPFAIAFTRAGAVADVPISAAREPSTGDWELGGWYGLVDGTDPSALMINGDVLTSVLTRVAAAGHPEIIGDLRVGWADALQAGPLGPALPDQAVVAPLMVGGGVTGVLVLGVNPYRPLDDQVRGFFALVSRQVQVALADAAAYANERARVQLMADLDQAKMEFFQNVSHELRTPLTLLLAPLQDLLAAAKDRPESEIGDLQAAIRAAERLRKLVDALLDFSGAEPTTLSPHQERVDLGALTVETASMFTSTATHAGLSFDVQVPAKPVTALVDRAMWSTVLSNLLSNAVKYTAGGGVRVELAVADGPSGGEDLRAVLTVQDTGRGMTVQEQSKVFDRFYRAPSNDGDRAGGAGIGLSLVSDLVRSLQGMVELQSEPGRGTTVTVSVPLGSSQVAHVASEPTSVLPAVADSRRHAHLVEDDDDLRAYLTRLLNDDGWAVSAFGDAETALAAAADPAGRTPDIVVTDIMLPGRSGLFLVERLRAEHRTKRLPILVLTARGGTDAAEHGLAAGADDYITKPFSSRELLARVRSNHGLHLLREQAVGDANVRVERINGALDSNRVIGTAVGIVMARHQVDADQGFQLLVRASQDSNSKLRTLASQVVEGGDLPFPAPALESLLARVVGDKQLGA